MTSAVYRALVRSHVVREFESAFPKATGIWLKLVPAAQPVPFCQENPACTFCALVASRPAGRRACIQFQADLHRRLHVKLAPQMGRCLAGMSVVAVPVLAGGEHIVTLLAGRVLTRLPAQSDLARLHQLLNSWGLSNPWPRARRDYLRVPIVSEEKFHAAVRVLAIFAKQLGSCVNRGGELASDDPPVVAKAKEFVHAHETEPLAMRQIARQMHVNPQYFCRIFKKATGKTFTEWTTEARIERAKVLLSKPFVRIADVAYAAGFGSIPHFNSVFRRETGMTPTEYRVAVR